MLTAANPAQATPLPLFSRLFAIFRAFSLFSRRVSPCNSEVHSAPAHGRDSHLHPLSGPPFRRVLLLFTVFSTRLAFVVYHTLQTRVVDLRRVQVVRLYIGSTWCPWTPPASSQRPKCTMEFRWFTSKRTRGPPGSIATGRLCLGRNGARCKRPISSATQRVGRGWR
jgi:hypothetical protein